MVAAGAVAAAKEHCHTMVLETQELAKKLTKPELKRMAESSRMAKQAWQRRQMHRLVAASLRTQAKFWLLMDDLVDQYLLASSISMLEPTATTEY